MSTIKLYRFVARRKYQRKMHGVFRGLNWEDTNIPMNKYEEVMTFINSELRCPMSFQIGAKNVNFWFTEAGYKKFGSHVEKLLELYYEYSPDYIREWDILEQEIDISDKKIKYWDTFQVALTAS